MLLAQNQQTQTANGATDCPTFGKKNTFSKAGLFQYMRTHKPQRIPDTQQQQTVYRPSALPDLKQAQEERDLAKNQSSEKTTSKKQRKERNRPVVAEEPEQAEPATKAVAKANPVREETKKPKAEESTEKVEQPEESKDDEGIAVKEESDSTEATADVAREKREKKMKRAAFKAKTQHLFKRSKKSSRKNDQKCPTF